MKIGNLDVKALYLGNDEIKKIYMGEMEIYSASTEPDIYPYLLAKRAGSKLIKILADASAPMYYINTPQVLENTLAA